MKIENLSIIKSKSRLRKEPCVIDLFCGAGGLTCGLIKSGIKVIAGFDIDESCQYPFEKNNRVKFIKKDIRNLSAYSIKNKFPKNSIKILAGCAPCQPFSKHTQKLRDRNKDDKWGLLYSFYDLVSKVKPHIVTMENVPEIEKETVFIDFVKGLTSLKYFVSWKTVYCPEYGIPQSRKRLVLLASKLGKINLIPTTHKKSNFKTVRDTISYLPRIQAGQIDILDKLHQSSELSALNITRIQQSKPGGTWRDWDAGIIAPCHRKESGRSYGSVYSRMRWDAPSPTITTQFYGFGTGRFGHPEQNRALSLREGALLQTFPSNYKFIAPKREFSIKEIGRNIGNAVPVRLGEVIGISILHHLGVHCGR
jgi:DNA (cytosine-5)-methyltransferase 1